MTKFNLKFLKSIIISDFLFVNPVFLKQKMAFLKIKTHFAEILENFDVLTLNRSLIQFVHALNFLNPTSFFFSFKSEFSHTKIHAILKFFINGQMAIPNSVGFHAIVFFYTHLSTYWLNYMGLLFYLSLVSGANRLYLPNNKKQGFAEFMAIQKKTYDLHGIVTKIFRVPDQVVIFFLELQDTTAIRANALFLFFGYALYGFLFDDWWFFLTFYGEDSLLHPLPLLDKLSSVFIIFLYSKFCESIILGLNYKKVLKKVVADSPYAYGKRNRRQG